jgi:hypothetical protein
LRPYDLMRLRSVSSSCVVMVGGLSSCAPSKGPRQHFCARATAPPNRARGVRTPPRKTLVLPCLVVRTSGVQGRRLRSLMVRLRASAVPPTPRVCYPSNELDGALLLLLCSAGHHGRAGRRPGEDEGATNAAGAMHGAKQRFCSRCLPHAIAHLQLAHAAPRAAGR